MITEWLSFEYAKQNFDQLATLANQNWLTSQLIYFGVYVAASALAIPGAAVLSLLGGALFGLWRGTLLVSFASTIGSSLAFLLARYFFRQPIKVRLLSRFGKQVAAIEKHLAKNGASYLFFLRLNPVFPFVLINSLLGLTEMNLATFFGVSLLGMLPGTILYVNAGTQIAKLKSTADLWSPQLLISFFLIGALPLILRKWFSKNPNHSDQVQDRRQDS